MQTGSAFILMGSFFGETPSSDATPFTSPAVAGSTFWPPAPAAATGSADLLDVSWLPPHATMVVASANPRIPTQAFRRRIELS